MVVQVRGLLKRYGTVVAVGNVSFEVYEGEIFGILGPNGAGKTTTIEILEGLRRPDEGEVRVLGFDPRKGATDLRERMGVQLQRTAVFRKLTVFEVLEFFRRLFKKRIATTDLIKTFGLLPKKNTYIRNLSGGEHQRLSVALAFVNDPELLFLDEPSTGMDPQARREMWDILQQARHRGKTILLTTHSMEEAERLCDRVAIFDQGRLIALDSPASLVRSFDASKRIEFKVQGEIDVSAFLHIEGVMAGENKNGLMILQASTPEAVLPKVFELAGARKVNIDALRIVNPTLEDVFLKLTGKQLGNENSR